MAHTLIIAPLFAKVTLGEPLAETARAETLGRARAGRAPTVWRQCCTDIRTFVEPACVEKSVRTSPICEITISIASACINFGSKTSINENLIVTYANSPANIVLGESNLMPT
jgi:hypothetical protein